MVQLTGTASTVAAICFAFVGSTSWMGVWPSAQHGLNGTLSQLWPGAAVPEEVRQEPAHTPWRAAGILACALFADTLLVIAVAWCLWRTKPRRWQEWWLQKRRQQTKQTAAPVQSPATPHATDAPSLKKPVTWQIPCHRGDRELPVWGSATSKLDFCKTTQPENLTPLSGMEDESPVAAAPTSTCEESHEEIDFSMLYSVHQRRLSLDTTSNVNSCGSSPKNMEGLPLSVENDWSDNLHYVQALAPGTPSNGNASESPSKERNDMSASSPAQKKWPSLGGGLGGLFNCAETEQNVGAKAVCSPLPNSPPSPCRSRRPSRRSV